MLHTCIKPSCGKQYKSTEEEAYYCPSCVEEKKALAATLDRQFSTKGRAPVVSDLQAFEAEAKVFTDPNTGRQIFFAKA